MRIDSSGRVGIGATSVPTNFRVEIAEPGSVGLNLRNTNNSANDSARIGFSQGSGNLTSSNTFVDIIAKAETVSPLTGSILFRTNRGNDLTDAMTIDSSGNLSFSQEASSNYPEQKLKWSNDSTTTNGFYLSQDTNRNGKVWHEQGLDILFGTNNTERMRIDSSGRLLVGTSSVGVSSTVVLQGRSGVTTGEAILRLCRGQDTPADGATLGDLSFGDSNNGDAARIFASRDGGTWTSASSRPSRLVFSTTADGASSPTERMRIRSNGQSFYFSDSSIVFRTVRTGAGDAFLSFQSGATSIDNGTQTCRILADGDLENANNNYGALSDVKLKENIVDAESQWEDLKAISVRNFNFKEELGFGTNTHIGVVAQELELVSPNLVKTSPDVDADENDLGTTTKSVKYSVLYMKAVKALQEAMERIETLEQRLSDAGIA
jgi:hypothetical protein